MDGFKGYFLPYTFFAEIFFILGLYFLTKLKTVCDFPPKLIMLVLKQTGLLTIQRK